MMLLLICVTVNIKTVLL